MEIDVNEFGNLVRAHRQSMGKTLLDVQRDLRIKASYIGAIESGDVDLFPIKSFIPGYVRSYGRYLQVDPEEFLQEFCEYSGIPYEMWKSTIPVVAKEKTDFELPKRHRKDNDSRFSGRNAKNWLTANRALSKKSLPRKTNPFDRWIVSASILAALTAIYIYLSFPFSGDAALEYRELISLLSGAVVFLSVNWFNPRFFFMKLVYLLYIPILASTILGLSFQIEGKGEYIGGYIGSNSQGNQSIVWPISILIALAMYFQFLSNRE